jgi:glutamyl-tRNA reductase
VKLFIEQLNYLHSRSELHNMSHHSLHLLCIGINHQTANVDLRERLAYTPHRLETSLARLGCGNGSGPPDIQELVILSTCNRVELYAVADKPDFHPLESFLAETQFIPAHQFSPFLYRLLDEQVVRHLLEVAAGLDSVVLGEPQILGQVTDAYSVARQHSTAGKVLSRLFQTAIHTGKRARTETAIGHNPASIASVAVNLVSATVTDLTQAQVMVLGAGEMAELAVESLRKRGVHHIMVVNRTLQRAQELAQRWNGQAAALEMLLELLPETDVVITSTGAPHTIIHPSMVAKAMASRPERPMVLMDIAVPRDVDTAVNGITGVRLYDMDALSARLENGLLQRKAEVPQVKAIVAEGFAEFVAYLATLDVVPLIVQMRRQANSIRRAEIEKTLRRIPDLPPEAHSQIETLTKSIVNKILHSPTVRLRQEANGPNAGDYADITRSLFGLD